MRGHRHSALVVLLVLLVACAPAATPTPTPTPILTPTSLPTATTVPTPALPPEGNVDVGGYTLYYRCAGSGSPTVIVEEGFRQPGASGTAWNKVAQVVAQTTRVCLYDRATLGKSKAEVSVRTTADVVRDLHNLLQNAPITGPYVLVASGVGGWFATDYAATFPAEVVGMVLVDPVPPDWLARELAVLGPQSTGEAPTITNYRNSESLFFGSTSGKLGEPLDLPASAAQAAQVTSLGDIPLVVLSSTAVSDLPKDVAAKLIALYQEVRLEQSRLSTNGRLVESATYYVFRDEWQLVVNTIVQVVEEARKR